MSDVTEKGPIVVVGPPGSGKSTVGRLLAERLGVDFHDADADIENEQGRAQDRHSSQNHHRLPLARRNTGSCAALLLCEPALWLDWFFRRVHHAFEEPLDRVGRDLTAGPAEAPIARVRRPGQPYEQIADLRFLKLRLEPLALFRRHVAIVQPVNEQRRR